MTLTSNNDILLSDINSSDIKLLTKSGEIKPFFSVSPLFPLGIHVTSDNTIIVGVMEGGNPYTPTDKSNGFISPDFVKSFISELSPDRSMSLFDVNVMS
jgi:hypothetical protein